MNMLTAATQGQRIEYAYDAAANDVELDRASLKQTTAFDFDSFVAGACEFFATQAKQTAAIGMPYVANEDAIKALEFTATIRITGQRRGAVHVTASRAMLTIMLMRMGATDITVDAMKKVLRDLATNMAAIARRDNMDDVLIWDPMIVADRQTRIGSDALSALVVPIHWRKFTAQVAICME
jgi:chemotaxis protein CheX